MRYLELYHNFIAENMDMARSIMAKKNSDFEKLKILLSKNIGYIGKFTEFLYHENIPYSDLENLYKDLIFLKSKSSSFDIQGFKYEKLLDKIEESKNNLTIKSFIDQFPSEQKNIIRSELKNDQNRYRYLETLKNIILKAARKENSKAFISKISRYKTFNDLYSAMKIFGKDAKNSRESVMEYVNSSKTATVVYDENNYLIILIESIVDVQYLGSDTSWCILGERMWKSYTKGRYQYILYNYNKEEYDVDFKIGFTMEKGGLIHSAHDILDKGYKSELRDIFSNLNLDPATLAPKSTLIPLTTEEISKIFYRISFDKLDEYVARCEIKDIPILVNKLISVFNNVRSQTRGHKIKVKISKLLNIYFASSDFIYQKDLISINSELPNWIYPERMDYKVIFDKPNLDDNFSDNVLIENIKNWKDKDLAAMHSTTFYDDFKNRKESILEIIFNRLDNIYRNPKITFRNTFTSGNKHYKGYKLSYPFELVYLLYGLRLKKDVKDKDEIIQHLPQDRRDELVDYLDIPIDLSFISRYRPNLSDNVIRNIIKKDYTDPKISITKQNYKQIIKLINHLNGFKLALKISKKSLIELKQQLRNDDSIIMRIINKFKARLITRTIVSEGNLSIMVY